MKGFYYKPALWHVCLKTCCEYLLLATLNSPITVGLDNFLEPTLVLMMWATLIVYGKIYVGGCLFLCYFFFKINYFMKDDHFIVCEMLVESLHEDLGEGPGSWILPP
jgi:hypothetical protein